MHISLESPEQHAIQAYSEQQIQINSVAYEQSLIVSKQEIVSEVSIKNIDEINGDYLELLLRHKPEIIIIGHNDISKLPPIKIIADLSQQGVGVEFMSVGAACRTYNVLLGELREVVLGLILNEIVE